MNELERVLSRDKFDAYLDRPSRLDFVALLRRRSRLFEVSADVLANLDPPCRDANDNQFLALALAAEADILVSGDDDLLVLHPWNGLAIVAPADFLSHPKFDR